MKKLFLIPCVILLLIGCGNKEKQLYERAQELCQYVPDHKLLPEAEKYKSYLRTAAEVYDMEFPNSFTENDDNFYDGFHLPNTVKPYLVELIFTDVQADCIRRTKP